MAHKITDPILSNWDERYQSLMNLPLYRIYRKFNEYFSYKRYDSNICNNSTSEWSPHEDLLLPMCHNVKNILKTSKSMLRTYTLVNVNKYCTYLNYFLYDQIKNSNINSNINEFYETLNNVEGIYDLKDECKIVNFNINKEQFDKKKELYFHGEILNWIKHKSTTFDSYYSSIFSTYFNECVNNYKKIIQDNYCQYMQHYKYELNTFLKNFKETKNILEQNNIIISSEDISLITKPTCSSEGRGEELASENVVLPGTNYQTVPTIVFPDSETTEMASDANTSANTGIVSGTLFGISLLSIFFLKFTPLGSRIQRKIWNKAKNYNLEHQNDEIILDTSTNEDIYSYNNEYNIQYHSA
ncbi:PIR protein [Plasmodium ovale]|uniref:PIR protein n=1 Tax=Plasmodium ovale TaxID=36330 RepID=A0A1C3KI97_PLAOA|nr:PIR protein [Plasmodium ovale]